MHYTPELITAVHEARTARIAVRRPRLDVAPHRPAS